MRQWFRRAGLIFCLLSLLTAVKPLLAQVPVGNLQPANNYGLVQMVVTGPDSAGHYTATFTVINTQPAGGYGIKGLLVYSPYVPISISSPPRCQTTLYKA